jgi:hypothetical protein
LHADHQLDQLAGQFAHWRQTRTHPYERIPQALWDHAVALAATLPPARVAKQLRLRVADLKKQMGNRHAAPAALAPLPLGFVEVPSAPAEPPLQAVTHIELSRTDGTRLCISTPASPLPLDAVVRAFVEGRSCCNCPPKAGSCSPRHRWISAKALIASRPCVGRGCGTTRWRAPSTCCATAPARRSSSCSMTGRGTGSV